MTGRKSRFVGVSRAGPWISSLAFALLMPVCSLTSAQEKSPDPTALVQSALAAYADAQAETIRAARLSAFARAERLFFQAAQALPADRANADLYANAGTAALQAERLGPAVLGFRRALVLDPDHNVAQRNLLHARSLLPAWVPRPGSDDVVQTFFFWRQLYSQAEQRGLAAVCFLVAAVAGALGLAARRRPIARLARGAATILGLAWLGLCGALVAQSLDGSGQGAVLVVPETIARASDSRNAPARFPEALPGGTEVVVLEARPRWARVTLASGAQAWVSTPSLAMAISAHAPHNERAGRP